MDNETKEILNLLLNKVTAIEAGQVKLEKDISGLKQDMTEVKQDISGLKSEVSEIKENVIITRHSTNLLLQWAEKTDNIVKVGLYQD